MDFDGTVCLHDVGVDLLARFGTDASRDGELAGIDRAFEAGAIGLRDVLEAEAATLRADDEELIAFALAHCPIDPTFAPFAAWAADEGLPLTVVSDGFGLHVEPLLAAAGLDHLPVITNAWDRGSLAFVAAHPTCVGCGTCKKQAVERAREAHGAVAFVGDGVSDRFGARYADVTFAKDEPRRALRPRGDPVPSVRGLRRRPTGARRARRRSRAGRRRAVSRVAGAVVTSLPDGLVARPLRETDLDAVVSMVNACELHDTGEVMLERADLVADAGAEGFDPETDWVGVFDGDRIVGVGTARRAAAGLRGRTSRRPRPRHRHLAASLERGSRSGAGSGRRSRRRSTTAGPT